MEETFDQKVIRNVQGSFAIYKTNEVIGEKSMVPNLEWSETEEVDKFFMFAKNLGAKVIYVAEGEDIDDTSGQTKTIIVQVGFLHQGIMHHINYAEDEEEDDDEYEYIDETDEGDADDEDEGEDVYESEPEQKTLQEKPPASNQPPVNSPAPQPQQHPAPHPQPTHQQYGQ